MKSGQLIKCRIINNDKITDSKEKIIACYLLTRWEGKVSDLGYGWSDNMAILSIIKKSRRGHDYSL